MALIACAECSAQVSDKAASCPHCGCPISDQATGDGRLRPTTIQQTSKDLKAQVLWSYGLFIMGIMMVILTPVWLGLHDQKWEASDLLYGAFVIVLGVGWQITTRFRIWWHHQ